MSWIVLAHYTMPTWNHSYSSRKPPLETAPAPLTRTSPPTLLHSPVDNFDTMSERAENLLRLQRVQEIAATPRSHSFSSSNNLDFGRFKRDLERRQRPESPALFREKSASNSMEDPHQHRDRGLKDMVLRDAASQHSSHTTVAERFSRPLASSRPSSAMSNSFLSERAPSDQRFSVSVNRPTRTATTNSILLPDNPFQISQAPAGPTPEFVRKASAASTATVTATTVPGLSRNSSGSNEYPLKSDGRNRKRPISAIFSDSDNGRRVSARPKLHRQSGRSRPASRIHDTNSRTKHVSPDTMSESALARKSKRLRETILDQNEDSRVIEETNFKVPQERIQNTQSSNETRKTQVANKTPTSPMKSSLTFARPKPPGKHRASTGEPPIRRISGSRTYTKDYEPTDPREERGSSSRTDSANNSFEQRMQKVQVWIKDRNPSMLSPPLTSSSETMHRSPTDDDHDHDYDGPKSQSSGKRKAQYQLRGKDPKRHHLQHEEQDTAPSSQQTLTSASKSSRHLHHERLDPLRDQQDPDTSTLPPVDWSRFQVKHTTPRKPSLAASTRTLSSPYRSRTLAGLPISATPKRLNSSLGSSDPSAVAVSPLIRLRQSQLQRRQQEDFLGIKRDGAASSATVRNQEEEEDLAATLQFNQVLETWEREDDETLARNAAREAEALEARGQALEEEGGSEGYTMAAPMPSLQRVIPLHGESSRRPVPDFTAKKAVHSGANGTTLGGVGNAPSLSSFNFRSTLSKSPWASKSSSSTARTPSSAERRHPGLFTPSKKNVAREQQELAGTGTKSPYKTTPTMSRYTQLTLLTDDENS